MTLKHDSQGFLAGEPIDLSRTLSLWTAIRNDVRAIRHALLNRNNQPDTRPERVATPRARDELGRFVSGETPRAERTPSRETPARSGEPTAEVTGRMRSESGRTAGEREREPGETPAQRHIGIAALPVSEPSPAVPGTESTLVPDRQERTSSGRDQHRGNTTAPSPAAERQRHTPPGHSRPREAVAEPTRRRGADGRFIRGDGEGGGTGSDRSSGDSWLRRIAEAVRGAGDLEEADPAVKAFNEVAQPLAQGYRAMVGDRSERKKEGWFKRIWGELKGFRREESLFNRSANRTLEEIRDRPPAAGGSGFMGMLGKIPGLGLLGKFLGKIPGARALGGVAGGALGLAGTLGKGLLKRIPLIGALFALGDSAFAESDESLSRDQKNAAHGRNAGTVVGLLAGGLLGSLAGPVGTAVGAAVGGWLGGAGGELIGGKFDGWVKELEAFNLPGKIEEAWTAAVEGLKSIPGKAIEAWHSVTAKVESLWNDFATGLKDKFGIDLPAIGKKIEHTAALVEEAIRENADIANQAIQEATGVDVKETASKAVEATVDFASRHVVEPVAEGVKAVKEKAGHVWTATKAAAGKVGDSIGGAWEGAKKIPAKVADRWNDAKGYIVGAAEKAGVDPGILAKIAHYESGGFNSEARPIAKDASKNRQRQFDGTLAMSTAHGYGQFLDGTWTEYINQYGAKYGIEGAGNLTKQEAAQYRRDKAIQAAMLAEFTRENVEKGRKYGGADDDANVYAMHNLGEGDAKKLLGALKANPNLPVSSILSGKVISGNRDLYGDGSITAAEAYKRMGDRMRRGDMFAASARKTATARTSSIPAAPATPNTLEQVFPVTVGAMPSVPALTVATPAPNVPKPPAVPAVADAPAVQIPLGGGNSRPNVTVTTPPADVGQDVQDRGIAHIVTGGYSRG